MNTRSGAPSSPLDPREGDPTACEDVDPDPAVIAGLVIAAIAGAGGWLSIVLNERARRHDSEKRLRGALSKWGAQLGGSIRNSWRQGSSWSEMPEGRS